MNPLPKKDSLRIRDDDAAVAAAADEEHFLPRLFTSMTKIIMSEIKTAKKNVAISHCSLFINNNYNVS